MVSALFFGTATMKTRCRSVPPVEAGPVVVPLWTTPLASVVPAVIAMSNRPLLILISAASAAT